MLTMLAIATWTAAWANPVGEQEALRAVRASVASTSPALRELERALVVRRHVRFAGGGRTRIGGTVGGRPVEGHLPVVSTDVRGRVRRVQGALPGRFDDADLVDAAEARAVATDTIGSLAGGAQAQTTRAIWWSDGTRAVAAWRVTLRSGGAFDDAPFATWEVVVDAERAAVRSVQRTSAAAEAFVYDPSPAVAIAERVQLATDDLTGPYVDARSCDHFEAAGSDCLSWIRQAVPDPAGDYLFHPRQVATPDPFAEVQAAIHADRMLVWLDDEFDLSLPYGPIDLFVNFPTANAFFGDFDNDGVPDISFGHDSRTGADFAYDADVVYHELGHAVVDLLAPELPFLQADALGMSWVSGAINEGAADAFAMVLTGDPLVGEHAGTGSEEGAIRDLTRLRRCPDHIRGQVHHDGELFGALMWSLQQHEAIGADGVAHLLVGAISTWGPDPTWDAIGASVQLAADDLHAAGALSSEGLAHVQAQLALAALPGCERVIDVGPGHQQTFYVMALGAGEPLDRIPASVQVRVGGHDELIIDELARFGEVAWSVYGRHGAPIDHYVLELAGLQVALADEFDWVVDADGDQLVLGGDDSPLPDGDNYLVFTGRNPGTLEPLAFELGVLELAFSAPSPAPASASSAAPQRSGPPTAPTSETVCACATGAPRPTWWPWLVFAGVVGRRRGRYTARR